MMRFWHEHSLSIGLAAISVALVLATIPLKEGWWYDLAMGLGHDAFGAFLIVVTSKFWYERGSPASK